MDKESITKWMNKMVRATKQFVNVKDIDCIQRCSQIRHKNENPYVQLYTGLHEIADALDLEVQIDYEDGDSICYLFTYKGVDFIQLDDKED